MISKLRRERLGRDLVVTIVCTGAVAALMPAFGATAPALAIALTGMLAFAASSLVARARRRAAEEKLSAEMTLLSERLLRLEARDPGDSSGRERMPPSQISAITDDLDVLSRLVRDLAETVAAHDRQIAGPAPDGARPQHALPAPPRTDLPPAAGPSAPPEAAPVRPEGGRIAASLLPFLEPFGTVPASSTPAEAGSGMRRDPLIGALDAGRVEVALQPIVSLPQRHTRLYEVLARLRVDDALVMPGEALPVLGRAGRMPDLDRAVLGQAIGIANHLAQRNAAGSLALNISPETLTHPAWGDDVRRIASEHPQLVRRLTFEIPQRDWQRFGTPERTLMRRLREVGIGFAIDHVAEPLRLEAERLREAEIRYVKLSAEMILDRRLATGSRLPILLADLSVRAIDVVAERVETEQPIPDLIDLNIPLAQGYAFARPRPLRADVGGAQMPAARTEDPEDPVRDPSPAATPSDERQRTFRDFLRRAG